MKKSLLLVLALGGCTDEVEMETVTIAPYRVPCVGVGQFACISGTTDNGEEKRFYDGIDGFEFVWGQTQRVTYSSHDLPKEEILADGSSVVYRLERVEVASVASPTDEFSLRFIRDIDPWFRPTAASDRVTFAGFEIACEPAFCAELTTRTADYVLRLQHGAPGDAVATALAFE